MAFTGTPVVTSLGKNAVRITGVSLAGNGASGLIGLFGDVAQPPVDCVLPANFPSDVDHVAAAMGLTMHDLVDVTVNQLPGAGQAHVHDDITLNPFRIIIQNDGGPNSNGLNILVLFLHSIVR